jgi:hypothetical protein
MKFKRIVVGTLGGAALALSAVAISGDYEEWLAGRDEAEAYIYEFHVGLWCAPAFETWCMQIHLLAGGTDVLQLSQWIPTGPRRDGWVAFGQWAEECAYYWPSCPPPPSGW